MKINEKGWFWFLVIVAVIALNQYLFLYFFKTSYFDWYLKNGSLIGAVALLVTFAWDINRNTGLISADPRFYLAAHFWLLSAQMESLSAFSGPKHRKPIQGASAYLVLFDVSVAFLVVILTIIIFVLWVLVVVPIQYLFVLVLGGPGRMYQSSPIRLIAKFTDYRLETREIPTEDRNPEEWMDVSVVSKPISFTYALIALVLAIVRYFMS